MVESGAQVNPKLNSGETPLHLAVKMNKADIVKILVDHGADVSAKDDGYKTPLVINQPLVHNFNLLTIYCFVNFLFLLCFFLNSFGPLNIVSYIILQF